MCTTLGTAIHYTKTQNNNFYNILHTENPQSTRDTHEEISTMKDIIPSRGAKTVQGDGVHV